MSAGRAALLSKRDISRGYDRIAGKLRMTDDFYSQCISLARDALHADARVLDVGCGQGRLLEMVRARYPRARLSGCDISWELCRLASKAAGTTVVQGDAAHLPLRGPFDVIFMTEVFEHLLENEHEAVLRQLRGMLGRNGCLVVSVPNRGWYWFENYMKHEKVTFQPIDDRWFTYGELTELFTRAQFDVARVRGLDCLRFYGWKHKVERAAAHLVPSLWLKMKRLAVAAVPS